MDQKVFEVTDGKTFDLNPTWSGDGRHLYFISNRGGSMDLWQQSLTAEGVPMGSLERLTTGLELRYVVFSPDGSRLAYSKGQNVVNLWRLPILPGHLPTWADARQLTFDQSGLSNLGLSPDLRHLAFDMYRDGRRHIWLLAPAGGDLRRLTTHPMNHLWPRWSPDGKSIAFFSDDVAGDTNIWIASVGGGPLSQLTRHPGFDQAVQWAPDGERISFISNRSGNLDVWIVSVRSGEQRQLTTDKGFDSACCANVWSPDGREIVFYSDRKGSRNIWIVSIEDGKQRQVTSGPAPQIQPSWSPTGEWIMYSSGNQLWRIRPSGGQPEALPAGSYAGLWSRDGKKVYYLVRNGFENIYEISVGGGPERKLTDLRGRYGTLGGQFDTDAQYFYFNWVEAVGDLWVMDVK